MIYRCVRNYIYSGYDCVGVVCCDTVERSEGVSFQV